MLRRQQVVLGLHVGDSICGMVYLDTVNIYCSYWLIKMLQCVARQDRARRGNPSRDTGEEGVESERH